MCIHLPSSYRQHHIFTFFLNCTFLKWELTKWEDTNFCPIQVDLFQPTSEWSPFLQPQSVADWLPSHAHLPLSQHFEIVFGRGSFTTATGSMPHLSSLRWYTTHSSVPHTTTVEKSCLQHCSTNGKLRILVQPITPSIWPLLPTRLDIRPPALSLPNEHTIGHCGLFSASRHRVAPTSRHYSLATHRYNWLGSPCHHCLDYIIMT